MKPLETMSPKSPRDRSMQGRSIFVAGKIVGLLNEIGQQVADEHWDGRELVTGLATAFKQVCIALNISPARALGIVNGVEAPPLNREISLLVQPGGRPLDAAPKESPLRIVGGVPAKLLDR